MTTQLGNISTAFAAASVLAVILLAVYYGALFSGGRDDHSHRARYSKASRVEGLPSPAQNRE